jgi:hypothetical protein
LTVDSEELSRLKQALAESQSQVSELTKTNQRHLSAAEAQGKELQELRKRVRSGFSQPGPSGPHNRALSEAASRSRMEEFMARNATASVRNEALLQAGLLTQGHHANTTIQRVVHEKMINSLGTPERIVLSSQDQEMALTIRSYVKSSSTDHPFHAAVRERLLLLPQADQHFQPLCRRISSMVSARDAHWGSIELLRRASFERSPLNTVLNECAVPAGSPAAAQDISLYCVLAVDWAMCVLAALLGDRTATVAQTHYTCAALETAIGSAIQRKTSSLGLETVVQELQALARDAPSSAFQSALHNSIGLGGDSQVPLSLGTVPPPRAGLGLSSSRLASSTGSPSSFPPPNHGVAGDPFASVRHDTYKDSDSQLQYLLWVAADRERRGCCVRCNKTSTNLTMHNVKNCRSARIAFL